MPKQVMPALPPEYTLLPGEEFVPLGKNERPPVDYYAGGVAPTIAEEDAQFGAPIYWYNTDTGVLSKLKAGTEALWEPTDEIPKYVIRLNCAPDDAVTLGKIVSTGGNFGAQKPEPDEDAVSYAEVLAMARSTARSKAASKPANDDSE